jgi:Bacterial PH domain
MGQPRFAPGGLVYTPWTDRGGRSMATYRSTADPFVKLFSALLLAMFAGTLALAVGAFLSAPTPGRAAALAGIAALLYAVARIAHAGAPTAYRLDRDALEVVRPIGTVAIPVGSIRSARTTDAWLGLSLGTWPGANGGLFGIYGSFFRTRLGRFTMYARRARGGVVLETQSGTVVVTPDEPARFVEELEQRVRDARRAAAPRDREPPPG